MIARSVLQSTLGFASSANIHGNKFNDKNTWIGIVLSLSASSL